MKWYLWRLELAARWRLPPVEAEDVVEDYREMLGQQANTSTQLEAQWGKPGQAVRQVSDKKAYRQWLAVFGLMTLCILLPLWGLLGWAFYRNVFTLLAALGACCSLVWFSRQGSKKTGKVPLALWALLLCQLLLAAFAGGTLWLAFYRWIALSKVGLLDPGNIGLRVDLAFHLAGLGSGALALLGLVLARVKDKRWKALYILGLTVLTLCLFTMSILHSMSLDSTIENWQRPYQIRAALTALVGLIATGVGLC